jgi:hypothetical protein
MMSNFWGSIGLGSVTKGTTITCNNGRVVINGANVYERVKRVVVETEQGRRELSGDVLSPQLHIEVTGRCDRIDTASGDVTVHGDTGSIQTMSGTVKADGDCGGGVSTMSGSVSIGGAVRGAVSTMSGSVRRAASAVVRW